MTSAEVRNLFSSFIISSSHFVSQLRYNTTVDILKSAQSKHNLQLSLEIIPHGRHLNMGSFYTACYYLTSLTRTQTTLAPMKKTKVNDKLRRLTFLHSSSRCLEWLAMRSAVNRDIAVHVHEYADHS